MVPGAVSASGPRELTGCGSISRGTSEHREHLVVPFAVLEVEHHRARRVGVVGDELGAARQLIDQPRIDRAEAELAARAARAQFGFLVEQPLELGARRSTDRSPGRCAATLRPRARAGRRKCRRCGGIARRSRDARGRPTATLPHHEGLALIGDADRRRSRRPTLSRRAIASSRQRDDRAIDFLGIVLDPSGLRIVLPNLGVGTPADSPARIDDEDGRAGGSLVDGKYQLRHSPNFSRANLTRFCAKSRERLNAEPAVGSAPPWAGVTPAPGIRIAKWRGRHFALRFLGGQA